MQCELCGHRAKKRLCPDCANMIARLDRAWRSLDMAKRGMLIWHSMRNALAKTVTDRIPPMDPKAARSAGVVSGPTGSATGLARTVPNHDPREKSRQS
jgi:hypothetical protein